MAIQIGIQLYSVRNSLAADPEGTLNALADLGLTRLEGANHRALTEDGIGFGISADFLANIMRDRGITIIGCQMNPLGLDRLPTILEFQQKIGNRRVGCDIEFYPYGDLEYVKRRADFFNEVGRIAAERDMEFFYHNHFQEFQRFGDKTVYELLMEYTDPDLVKFELDTYWAYRGGADPIELFRTYPERFIRSAPASSRSRTSSTPPTSCRTSSTCCSSRTSPRARSSTPCARAARPSTGTRTSPGSRSDREGRRRPGVSRAVLPPTRRGRG
jgi:hypothetical protein